MPWKNERSTTRRKTKQVLERLSFSGNCNKLFQDEAYMETTLNKHSMVLLHAKQVLERKTVTLLAKATRIWRKCWYCIKEIIDNLTWEFGPGTFSMRYENWLGVGCLSPHLLPTDELLTLEEDANRSFSLPYLDEDAKADLQESYNFLKIDISSNNRIWPHDPSGQFTIKSFKNPNVPRNHSSIFSNLWKTYIPPKISIFL
ncbi:hypothetical protein FRX31_025266 [Thalictrum thalictroides]|uniref:Uncharacterized protein n=1 Tax=Thalictrum thalictroides TaxID=46969 RepID=A0A7J6VLX5_THATH|nr:hypothetical protein FRX31_025266 [Thalictrum thalictroides]